MLIMVKGIEKGKSKSIEGRFSFEMEESVRTDSVTGTTKTETDFFWLLHIALDKRNTRR